MTYIPSQTQLSPVYRVPPSQSYHLTNDPFLSSRLLLAKNSLSVWACFPGSECVLLCPVQRTAQQDPAPVDKDTDK